MYKYKKYSETRIIQWLVDELDADMMIINQPILDVVNYIK